MPGLSEVSIASSFHQVGVVSSYDPQCSEARGRAPSQPAAPTKYLINGRNCDTISNEPFIEPHLDNPEIGSRASRVPNQRIPPQCRRRSFPPTATSTHLSFVKRSIPSSNKNDPQTSWRAPARRLLNNLCALSTLGCSQRLSKEHFHQATNLLHLRELLR